MTTAVRVRITVVTRATTVYISLKRMHWWATRRGSHGRILTSLYSWGCSDGQAVTLFGLKRGLLHSVPFLPLVAKLEEAQKRRQEKLLAGHQAILQLIEEEEPRVSVAKSPGNYSGGGGGGPFLGVGCSPELENRQKLVPLDFIGLEFPKIPSPLTVLSGG